MQKVLDLFKKCGDKVEEEFGPADASEKLSASLALTGMCLNEARAEKEDASQKEAMEARTELMKKGFPPIPGIEIFAARLGAKEEEATEKKE